MTSRDSRCRRGLLAVSLTFLLVSLPQMAAGAALGEKPELWTHLVDDPAGHSNSLSNVEAGEAVG
jgi:hypothetical protein